MVDDTAISAYLIQPDRRSYELADLSQVHLKISVGTSGTGSSGQLDLGLEEDTTAADAVMKAFVALQLSEHFVGQLLDRGANRLLGELELPLARVLASMELTGIAVDADQAGPAAGGLHRHHRRRAVRGVRGDRP